MSLRIFGKALLIGRAFLLDSVPGFMDLTDVFDMEQSNPPG
ncbi:hypothetical protein [Thalassospira povalilytica]|tara:strand:+ start:405 stop:527 length:123 start_codon:yes stop_codon:yes gene_type:complete